MPTRSTHGIWQTVGPASATISSCGRTARCTAADRRTPWALTPEAAIPTASACASRAASTRRRCRRCSAGPVRSWWRISRRSTASPRCSGTAMSTPRGVRGPISRLTPSPTAGRRNHRLRQFRRQRRRTGRAVRRLCCRCCAEAAPAATSGPYRPCSTATAVTAARWTVSLAAVPPGR